MGAVFGVEDIVRVDVRVEGTTVLFFENIGLEIELLSEGVGIIIGCAVAVHRLSVYVMFEAFSFKPTRMLLDRA